MCSCVRVDPEVGRKKGEKDEDRHKRRDRQPKHSSRNLLRLRPTPRQLNHEGAACVATYSCANNERAADDGEPPDEQRMVPRSLTTGNLEVSADPASSRPFGHAWSVARYVLHMDLDQFIAAVELLRRPELRGKPVVVGGDGDPTKRGVVSTANYEARTCGIHSAMPLRTAYKLCPEAVFLPVDAEAYQTASRAVMATLRSFPAMVEVAGWDEASMAVETACPETFAREVQRAVLDRTGLSCSIGVGDNKLRAKLACGFAKPAGVFRLTRENWAEVMDGLPTEALLGIGVKTAGKLAALAIRTVEELATADEEELARTFGPTIGPWLRHLATGEDATPVTGEPHVPKGRGKERTFQEDIRDPDEIRRQVASLARELSGELASASRPVVRLVVKVRFAPFDTHTHGATLPEPTLDRDSIEAASMAALDRFDLDRRVRLLGVRAELLPPRHAARPTLPGDPASG